MKVSEGNEPSISVQGHIELQSQEEKDLVLVTWPDPDSQDMSGNPGSGHYYLHGIIKPDQSGCWNDPAHSVGYPGVKGITDVYYLVLVPQSETAQIIANVKGGDGYSPEKWDSFGFTTVYSFTVPTKDRVPR